MKMYTNVGCAVDVVLLRDFHQGGIEIGDTLEVTTPVGAVIKVRVLSHLGIYTGVDVLPFYENGSENASLRLYYALEDCPDLPGEEQ